MKTSNRTQNRRLGHLVLLVLSFLLAGGPCLIAQAKAAKKLNVLFIVADDLNNEVGVYGSIVKTPSLERLATHAVRFDRAYCNFPVCNPSRASFLSGFRPDKTGVVDLPTPTRTYLKHAVMLPEYFRKNGYRSLKVGKVFHTGDQHEDPRSWDVDIRESTTAKTPPPEQILQEFGERGLILKVPDEMTWEYLVATQAVAFVEQSVAEGKPFFVAAGFRRPHAPYVAPKKYFDMYDVSKLKPRPGPPEHLAHIPKLALTYNLGDPALPADKVPATMNAYFASISFMDAQLGHILDAADRLKLWDNTVVVFISDHGYHMGEHGGLWHKMTLFEESARVPVLVAAPGKKSGAVSMRLVELVDLYPTLVELCGLPNKRGLEGTSFAPLLDQPNREWKKAAFTVVARPEGGSGENSSGVMANQKLDPKWLGRSVRTETWRYTEWPDGTAELYDHRSDSYEYANLAGSPQHAEKVAELRKLLHAGWKAGLPGK
jgi:iduronate 2-sulfatase